MRVGVGAVVGVGTSVGTGMATIVGSGGAVAVCVGRVAITVGAPRVLFVATDVDGGATGLVVVAGAVTLGTALMATPAVESESSRITSVAAAVALAVESGAVAAGVCGTSGVRPVILTTANAPTERPTAAAAIDAHRIGRPPFAGGLGFATKGAAVSAGPIGVTLGTCWRCVGASCAGWGVARGAEMGAGAPPGPKGWEGRGPLGGYDPLCGGSAAGP